MNVIKAENLGKKYIISHQQRSSKHTNLRDVLSEKISKLSNKLFNPFTRNETSQHSAHEEFWALRDVSFEIKQGERVGIIGRNGAGKSTLLKILSRITEPTTGRVSINGRIASLLEVGTGFHPELTGRENIYLNAAILGMKKREIERRFDEIVSFAEIEKFIDTPVKHYSSGMYVRLAFAVAAHLEPEILVVDEVLAVGDAQFQKKCLGRMKDISNNDGRTILFVSHNMGVIKQICKQSILLEKGNLVGFDNTKNIISLYISESVHEKASWQIKNENTTNEIFFEEILVKNNKGRVTSQFTTEEDIYINLKLKAIKNVHNAQIAIRFTNQEGIPIFTTANTDTFGYFVELPAGEIIYTIHIDIKLLIPGIYSLIFAVSIPGKHLYHKVENEINISIIDTGSIFTALKDDREGVVSPIIPWIKNN